MPTMSSTVYIETFVSDWEGLQSAVQFERLCKNLLDARILASKGESKGRDTALKLGSLFKLLPYAIKRITNSDDVAVQGGLECYVFEVMWALVEVAVVVLSKEVDRSEAVVDLLSLIKLLEAVSALFDSSSQFFKLRGEKNRREITVRSWRLESVIQVPGFFVKVSGATNGQIHYMCAKKGVNHVGEGCECCKPPPEADGVLVNLTWLFASGFGYDHILRMLSVPREYSLITVELLLRPLVHLLEYSVGSKTWRRLMEFTEVSFNKRAIKTEFKNVCFNVCSELYRYLDDLVRAKEFNPCPNFDTEYADQWTFSDVLHHVHSITVWGVAYYAGSIAFESLRPLVCKLQEKMWERMLEAKRFSMACTSIGAAIEASLAPSPGTPRLSLEWLKEKKVVLKLLNVRYEMKNVSKVIDFVNILARRKGVVMVVQKDFISVMRNAGSRAGSNPHLTILDTDADDLIVAAMLESLDLSAYTSDFFEYALNWLEDCQVASPINGSKIFHVLNKLFIHDTDKKWETRFLKLLWKHAASIPDNELVECFSNVADHYTSNSEIESLKKTLPTSGEQSKLLQDCKNADTITCISDDVSDVLNHTKLYGQKAKSWEEKEADLLLLTSSNLANVLAIGVPYARQDTANECLKRLVLAHHVTGGLSTDGSETLASAMTTAMIPEFQALEALKTESVVHCEVVRRVQELSEKHVRDYDSMRQEQHERLVKFFQTCRKEKEDVIWEALHQKAKVMASVKKAMINRDVKLSSADILARMLQKAEGAFKEVGNKHKENLERLPNDECAVCMTEFSLKRKRACLDPCGHASACVECATQEYKRTKSCPLCKTNIEKPIAVPYKLFF
ncbi:hypothetical protein KC19_4G176900 [Ceratodon purpureus]|uniref:RING-type domain-containing protein n=1 Tax=Ceratodon purpureus TaxID=3225 RepID=A0A8T0IC20_CERPU|nr:hypothetical protein KC19_4G176900 [Ceratodon purpureus]